MATPGKAPSELAARALATLLYGDITGLLSTVTGGACQQAAEAPSPVAESRLGSAGVVIGRVDEVLAPPPVPEDLSELDAADDWGLHFSVDALRNKLAGIIDTLDVSELEDRIGKALKEDEMEEDEEEGEDGDDNVPLEDLRQKLNNTIFDALECGVLEKKLERAMAAATKADRQDELEAMSPPPLMFDEDVPNAPPELLQSEEEAPPLPEPEPAVAPAPAGEPQVIVVEERDAQDLRKEARATLLASVEDGRLEQALADASARAKQAATGTCRDCGGTGTTFLGESCSCPAGVALAGKAAAATCRDCGGTGTTFLGESCSCPAGVALAGKPAAAEAAPPSGTCRDCGGTGLTFLGGPCSCPAGAALESQPAAEAAAPAGVCRDCGGIGRTFLGGPCSCPAGAALGSKPAAEVAASPSGGKSAMDGLKGQLFGDLLSAVESGALEQALFEVRVGTPGTSNTPRQRQAEASAVPAAAPAGPAAAPAAVVTSEGVAYSEAAVEALRTKLWSTFMDSLDDGRLEASIEQVIKGSGTQVAEVPAPAPAPPTPPPAPAPAADPGPPVVAVARGPKPGAISEADRARMSAVLRGKDKGVMGIIAALSERDRRAGELLAMVQETERMIGERENCCRHIESMIDAARVDLAHLALDMESGQRMLELANGRHQDLEAQRQRLLSDLATTRSLAIKCATGTSGAPLTSRSDLSTALPTGRSYVSAISGGAP